MCQHGTLLGGMNFGHCHWDGWRWGAGDHEDNFLDHPSLLEHLASALKPAGRRWMADMGKPMALNYLGRSKWARGERGIDAARNSIARFRVAEALKANGLWCPA